MVDGKERKEIKSEKERDEQIEEDRDDEQEGDKKIRTRKGNFGRMRICINAPQKVYAREFR